MNISEQFLQQIITFTLLVIEKVINQMEKTYKDDLTFSEFYALSAVNYFGDMTMTVFANNFGIQKQQATRIINKLVQKGYIQRIYDNSDRRIVLIRLTQEAKSYLSKHIAKSVEIISDSLSGFAESEIREFQTAIETINRMLPKMITK